MILKIKNQNKTMFAFTLIEMLIVLIIMGILLMVTMYLSGDQIQRVKDKTVKESILAERQSRYSRNLGSSSYAGKMYKYLDITLSTGSGEIYFNYESRNDGDTGVNNVFKNTFNIKSIVTNPNNLATDPGNVDSITFRYTPYQLPCEWGAKDENGNLDTGNMNDELLFVTRVNDSRNYCFLINKKNCRLMEVSRDKCEIDEFLINNQQE